MKPPLPPPSFSGCGVVRHPIHVGWFLKHNGANSWEWTKVLHEAVVLWDRDLEKMLKRIPGSTWMPTTPWLEQPDGSCSNGWKGPIPYEWGGKGDGWE